MSDNLIEIENLNYSIGARTIYRDLDLTIQRGQVTAIMGPSGTGKTTLLRLITRQLVPDSGTILVDGIDIASLSQSELYRLRQRFGMLFQGAALFDSMRVWENVAFGLMNGKNKLGRKEARKIADDNLVKVGLAPEVGDLSPAELSGGMQKRVALARAIADKPEILLFDEPTSGLDPITGGVIDRLIIDAVRRLGATTVTISHDMASVRRIADKVAMVHNGVILWCGDVKDMDKSGVPEVHQFVHGLAEGPLTQIPANAQKGRK